MWHDSKVSRNNHLTQVCSGGFLQVRVYTRRVCVYTRLTRISERASERGSSMTMRHGEHSATVDPGYAGSFPPSATAASTPLAARHRHPLPRALFCHPPASPLCYLPPPFSSSAFVFLTATCYYRNHLCDSPPRSVSLIYPACRVNDEQRCIYQVVRPM